MPGITSANEQACHPRDSVDALVAAWQRVRPELDLAPIGIVARLGRARAHVDVALDAVFAAHGLSAADFAVLVTLVRLDRADGVPQRTLMEELGLTAGTVSVRVDRLESAGLVARRAATDDRRATLVALTGDGRATFERVAPEHLANERRLLSALDADEQAQLARLLRKLLVEYEGVRRPADAAFRLGLVLAPAHLAMAMRAAVGLPPVRGLLVRQVEEASPAAAALRTGDVLVRAGSRPLASVAALYAALLDAAPTGRLVLAIVRGADELDVALPLPVAPQADLLAAVTTSGRAAGDAHVV